ncbi:DUF2807 domain-containing protein [Paracrocinitomix mangrovi]|uniref:head GIN domain-containing protein n=1 Tax=Paracrocinitomix mangrovi TaxID=2862509 RepID=UPI001C8E6419|nr:head GIN domain-containing protein [Paracrocinitomix mangrovi]UKN02943.1 DUF2807 domain-containing protein [Paracrocinitomix mangrovi]
MKNLYTLLALVLCINISFAGEKEEDLSDFTSVESNGNFKLFLKKGDKNHIKVINNEPELEDNQIVWEVKGGKLSLDIKKTLFKKLELEIYVTYNELSTIDAKGGSWIQVENVLTGNEIELNCSTDGIISAELDCKTVNASIAATGNGNIKLRGKADYVNLKVATGGFITAKALEAKEVVAKISSGGEISCWAKEKMDLKVTIAGVIKYIYDGDEANFKEKTTGGEIKKFKS